MYKNHLLELLIFIYCHERCNVEDTFTRHANND